MDYCVGTVQIRFVYVRITPWVPGGSPGKNSHGVPTYFSGIFHGNPRVIPSFLLGSRGNPAQMTNLQTQLRVSRMEDKRYTMHSIRVGGVTSHGMDGTAMDRSHGVREFSRNDILRCGRSAAARAACMFICSVPTEQSKAGPLDVKVEVWVWV